MKVIKFSGDKRHKETSAFSTPDKKPFDLRHLFTDFCQADLLKIGSSNRTEENAVLILSLQKKRKVRFFNPANFELNACSD